MGYDVRIVWSELGYAAAHSKQSKMGKADLVVIEMGIYGWLFPIAYYGVFRERDIVDALKIRRNQFQTWSYFSLEL